MNLLTNDSALTRGIRTGLQTLCGFVVGLAMVIWNTPGVSQNVSAYISQTSLEVLLSLGIPTVVASGVIAYLFNLYREKNQTPVVIQTTETPIAETGSPVEPSQA